MLLREDMMSQRFTLFYAGFTAHAPALYFSQVQFLDDCRLTGESSLEKYISKLSDTIRDSRDESATHLKTAISVADHLEIEILPQPDTFEDYFNWLTHYIQCFETHYPMGRIDHYYFLYARKISEILLNVGLLETYIQFQLSEAGSPLDIHRKMDKCLKDTEYILFKLMAAAALLSSEPRQNYFNTFYRTLCQEFLPFKELELTALSASDLNKLDGSLKEYNLVVMDGFKKCISLLKELGI